jgi:4-amino-4-deoxy-L-arabinose transferase-like glycosyltransferase
MTSTRWLLLLALVLFGWNVWGYDLWAPNEPFFGEGAREMIDDGKWIVPHLNGEISTHKPPLFFWLIALCSLPFGEVTSLAARLPSILASVATVWLTVRLERRVSGDRVALLAGAMLTVNYFFWDKARSAQIDALLCLLVTVAVAAFAAYRAGELDGGRAGLAFWAAAALAVLAKGPVGVLVPLGIVLVTLAWDRRLSSWRGFAPLLGPLAFAAILGAWIAAATLWGEGYSVWGALQEHFVDRAIHGMHHAKPLWYYLKVLPYALLPWTLLLPGAWWLAWRRRDRPEDRLVIVWIAFVVIFFTLPTEKRDLYILPAWPAFAMLFARHAATVLGWRDAGRAPATGRRWVTVPQGIFGALAVLAAAAALVVADRIDDDLIPAAAVLAAILAIGGCGILATAVRGAAGRTLAWTGAMVAATLLAGVSVVFPLLDPSKSGRELAVAVRDRTAEHRASGGRVLGFELINVVYPVNLYSGGVYLEEVPSSEDLLRELSLHAPLYVLADSELLPELPNAVRQRMRVVYETRLSRKDLQLLYFGA